MTQVMVLFLSPSYNWNARSLMMTSSIKRSRIFRSTVCSSSTHYTFFANILGWRYCRMIFKAEGLSYCRPYRAEAPINIFLSFRCRLLARNRRQVAAKFSCARQALFAMLELLWQWSFKVQSFIKSTAVSGKISTPTFFYLRAPWSHRHPWRCKGIIHGLIPCRSNTVVFRRLLTGHTRE